MSYTLSLTGPEVDSLRWVACRYTSALTLLTALQPVRDRAAEDEELPYTLSECDAWSYLDDLEREDGAPAVPPCVGGTLASKLIALREAVV